jgi:hypothetical protein
VCRSPQRGVFRARRRMVPAPSPNRPEPMENRPRPRTKGMGCEVEGRACSRGRAVLDTTPHDSPRRADPGLVRRGRRAKLPRSRRGIFLSVAPASWPRDREATHDEAWSTGTCHPVQSPSLVACGGRKWPVWHFAGCHALKCPLFGVKLPRYQAAGKAKSDPRLPSARRSISNQRASARLLRLLRPQ